MGCFNVTGFYSHLPIECGDRIGAILCAKTDRRESLSMETVSTGIYPMMAPVYGEYNDYGGIESMDESASAQALKVFTGYSIEDFNEMIHDFGDTSLKEFLNNKGKSKEGEEEYVNVLKKLLPKSHISWNQKKDKEYLAKAILENDELMIDALKSSLRYHKNEIARIKSATFFFIFEHEAVLKKLHDIGSSYMNGNHWYRDLDASKSYDAVAKYVSILNGTIFDTFSAKMKFDAEKIKKIEKSLDRNPNSNSVKKATQTLIESLQLETEATKAERELISDTIKFSDYFGCIYRNNPKVNYLDSGIKSEILDMLYIDRGLYWLGGMYEASKYAGQEVHPEELIAMNTVISNIINNKNKND